jgi:hypothetical protein
MEQHPDTFFKFRLEHSYLGTIDYKSFDDIPTKFRRKIDSIRPSLIDCLPSTEEEARPYLEHEAILPPYRIDFDGTIYIEVKNEIPIVSFSRSDQK